MMKHSHGSHEAGIRQDLAVVGAGITSALGDFCYETTTVLLPGFLAMPGNADTVASFTKRATG